jgi:hypothetical protein
MLKKLTTSENTQHLALVHSTISSTSVCYAKYHTINNHAFEKKLLMMKNNVMLTISGGDTSRPLDIKLRLFANIIHDVEYLIQGRHI